MARAAWVVVAVSTIVVVAAGFVLAFADPDPLSIPALTELFEELNLGLRLMMSIALAGPFAAVVIVSTIVFLRRSNDPMALLLTSALLTYYAYATRSLLVYEGVPILDGALSLTFIVAAVLLTLTLSLFPNGLFVPRWIAWLAPVTLLMLVFNPDAGRSLMDVIERDGDLTTRKTIMSVGLLLIWSLAVVAQVVRYRKYSTDIERQQTKWAIAPLGLWGSLTLAAVAVSVAFPGGTDRITSWIILLSIPLNFLIPLALAIAVLKYRLYEIDRIISRTLAYTLVVGVLGIVYAFGAVWIPTRFFGGGSPVFVAGSTLVVAAMFTPLRNRIQLSVDRRFNRSSFRAETISDRFGERLKETLSVEELVGLLDETVTGAFQPRSSGIWLNHEN